MTADTKPAEPRPEDNPSLANALAIAKAIDAVLAQALPNLFGAKR